MVGGPMIDYEALQQDALRGIVRAALHKIAATGLPGEHHFYISFLTQAPGVVLSKRLKEKYPHEMTIVLQHRFWDLIVSDDRFEVKLTFDGVPERLVVPFTAIKVFIDPSVQFGLQFEEPGQAASAPNRSLTMDAAYDSVGGEVRPDSPRATIAKKPRTARKPRADKDAAANAPRTPAPARENETPEPMPPQPEPASAAGPALVPSPADGTESDKSGAKVVSLDAFRKK